MTEDATGVVIDHTVLASVDSTGISLVLSACRRAEDLDMVPAS